MICIVLFYYMNKNFLLLWNANNINVSVEKPLEKEKVKIEFGISINTISRKNDLDLFQNKERYTILYDKGKKLSQMINEYGENDFLITYNNEYYLSFRQFKIHSRVQHDYYFHFRKAQDTVFVKVEIKGLDDNMKFERAMLEIKNAEQYRCNSLIDNTKVLYNMIELVPINN